jgi:hypothetical protein
VGFHEIYEPAVDVAEAIVDPTGCFILLSILQNPLVLIHNKGREYLCGLHASTLHILLAYLLLNLVIGLGVQYSSKLKSEVSKMTCKLFKSRNKVRKKNDSLEKII